MNYEWLDGYLLSKKGVAKDFKEEWQWTRYQLRGKLFAAIAKDKQGEAIITLKLPPQEGGFLRQQYPDILPGYYMNKQWWNSVRLCGDVPDEKLRGMIDTSYSLVFSAMSKKAQREVEGLGQ